MGDAQAARQAPGEGAGAAHEKPRDASRAWLAVCCASIPLAVLLTLALIDWNGRGTARPFVMLFLPAVVGVLGGLAGARARHPVLAVGTGLLGILLVPAAMCAVLLLEGP